MALNGVEYSGKDLSVNGSRFHVLDSGGKGEPVVFLHGFPNDGNLWRHQAPAVAEAGFRAVVPDMRGFGQSARPKDGSSYEIHNLVKDIEGIMDALDIKNAHIIGHDWGAILAWAFAGIARKRTKTLTSISNGHPRGFFSGEEGYNQRKASWYMLLFQFPGVGDKALVEGAPIFSPANFAPTEPAKQDYADMYKLLARPETERDAAAVTAGLNYYRANIKPEAFTTEALLDLPDVACNTFMIYPTGDAGLLQEYNAKNSDRFVESPHTFRYEQIESPTHFAPWDAPEPVTALILDFLLTQKSK